MSIIPLSIDAIQLSNSSTWLLISNNASFFHINSVLHPRNISFLLLWCFKTLRWVGVSWKFLFDNWLTVVIIFSYVSWSDVKVIPTWLVPQRYLNIIMYLLVLSIWAWLGFAISYLASMLVFVDMLGLVEMESQFKLSMSIFIKLVAQHWSFTFSCDFDTESTR